MKINKKNITIVILSVIVLSCIITVVTTKSKGKEIAQVEEAPIKIEETEKKEYVVPRIEPDEADINEPKTIEELKEETNVNYDNSLNSENSIALTITDKETMVAKSQSLTKPSEPSTSASNVAEAKAKESSNTTTKTTTTTPPPRTEANTKAPITDVNDPNYDPMKDPTRKPDETPITQEDLAKVDDNVEPPATSNNGGGTSSNGKPKEGDRNDKGQIYDGVFGWVDLATGSTISGGEDLGGDINKMVGIME